MNDIIKFAAFIFIIWEIVNLILSPFMWKLVLKGWYESKNPFNNYPVLNFVNISYIIYGVVLLFTKWYWVSLLLAGLSLCTAIVLLPLVKDNRKYDISVFLMLLLDSLISIFLLNKIVEIL